MTADRTEAPPSLPGPAAGSENATPETDALSLWIIEALHSGPERERQDATLAHIKTALDKSRDLERERNQLRLSADRLQAENADRKIENGKARAEIHELTADVSALENALEEVRRTARYKAHSAEKIELRKLAEAELAATKRQLGEAQNRVVAVESMMENLALATENHQAALAELTERIEAAKGELPPQRCGMNDDEAELRQSAAALIAAKDEVIAGLREKLDSCN